MIAQVTPKLKDIITTLPGYNPYDQAGDEYTFDPIAAQKRIDFFHEMLHHGTGSQFVGKPFILEAWQQAIIANLFGWRHRVTGFRRYREAFILVGRKNGKSPMAAGLLLCLLWMDNEAGAQIYGAAAAYHQACHVFNYARQMVELEPEFATELHVFGGKNPKAGNKCITLESQGSVYMPIAADAHTEHGENTYAYVVDELHAHPNAELMDTLETAVGAREQPLGIMITTPDYERPDSVCNEKHDYAREIRDNKGDRNKPGYAPWFLPAIYECDEKDDWHDEEVWRKANPNVGVSLSWDYLRQAYQKAKEVPRFKNKFLRLHLCIRTRQVEAWLNMERWAECAGSIDMEALEGQLCYAGLDVSSNQDITAFVLLFPQDGNRFVVLPFFWVADCRIKPQSHKHWELYKQWVDAGYIETTVGDEVEISYVRNRINEIGEQYGIRQIAADRLFQGAQLVQDLANKDGFDVVSFGQGFLSMAAPTEAFESAVVGRRLTHGDNPVMNWMAGNVAVQLNTEGNCKKPVKVKGKVENKIDGIVCAVMAMGIAALDATGAIEPSITVLQ